MSRTCTCDNAGVCPSCKRLASAMDEMRECREHNARADAEERATASQRAGRATTTAPSPWAMERARRVYLHGECRCDHNGACDPHTDIAVEIEAGRRDGAERMRESAAGKCADAARVEFAGLVSPDEVNSHINASLACADAIRRLDTDRVLAGEE